MRNFSQSGSSEQGEKQRFKGIFQPKTSDLKKKKKKVFTEIVKDFPPEIAKKKVFSEIVKDFPPEIANSSSFSSRKQVISKKKGLHPKNLKKSVVSPQKTPIGASICTPVAPILLISSGHSPRLGGHSFRLGGAQAVSWGGTAPVCPPWRRV